MLARKEVLIFHTHDSLLYFAAPCRMAKCMLEMLEDRFAG